MGQAARKVAGPVRAVSSRPELRLIRGGGRSVPGRKPRKSSASERVYRSVFRLACTAMVVLAAFAMLRVSMSSQAAAAAMDANKLRTDIKAEKLVSDKLQMDRSTLETPSRIANIATKSMKMRSPGEVDYIKLPATAAKSGGAGPRKVEKPSPARMEKAKGLVAWIMGTAAGEAQALLVGDVGISSSRR